jgi:pilus assembly protein Flp/PilA
MFRKWVRHGERGASAVEYGLLIGFIAAVIILVVFSLGGSVSDLFGETCQNVHHQGFGASSC